MFGDVRRHVERVSRDRDLAEHLARVVWELTTNLVAHVGVANEATITVEIEGSRVTVRLPGPCFDSVARSQTAGARGLDTAAYRLSRSGWHWSHRHVDGTNEVSLEKEAVIS
jgi:hypothetical protein